MDQKDKITKAIQELSLERLKKLQQLAISQMTESQKHSWVFNSILDLKCREIMSRYCK